MKDFEKKIEKQREKNLKSISLLAKEMDDTELCKLFYETQESNTVEVNVILMAEMSARFMQNNINTIFNF